MFVAGKLLFAVFSPLGLAVLVLFFLSILTIRTWKFFGLIGLFLTVFLVLCSTQPVAVGLARILENGQIPRQAAEYPATSAIVVLGGGLEQDVAVADFPGLGAAADRVLLAARLYAAGRAPEVILLGGGPEGQPSEARAMQAVLKEWGVPASAMVLEDESRTTWENAVNCREYLSESASFILVTSAWHMPRAMWIFRAAGMKPIPAPTDFQGVGRSIGSWVDWLPSSKHLEVSSLMIHELGGMLFYRIRSLMGGI